MWCCYALQTCPWHAHFCVKGTGVAAGVSPVRSTGNAWGPAPGVGAVLQGTGSGTGPPGLLASPPMWAVLARAKGPARQTIGTLAMAGGAGMLIVLVVLIPDRCGWRRGPWRNRPR